MKLIPVNEIESQNPFFLIGRSDGKTIYNTAIAPDMTINKKPEAVSVYQQYVFLHEFFHTIESMRRTPEQRRDIVLEYNGTSYTFQDWWEEFEDIMLSGQEPEYISQYAKTYTWSINQETKKENYRLFSHCIAESVADSFAAYFVKTI